ncbi:hypothetical protein [Paenibacillus sp. NEAU-GSW1]|uniref:hypothetical protein n=1 Tax=Paenibacillus sp. NEAU-GSW1 TaxID=2682486 RepID=UPI0020A65A9C|nr:hypothetical protein [Paenibacillus sp. NEAU-GSW1]
MLGGMLCIGRQGCEYDMYLVIEGERKGRIVYSSGFYPDHPFFFVYEDNMLDWYERWLDEVILDYDIAWFGSRMSGHDLWSRLLMRQFCFKGIASSISSITVGPDYRKYPKIIKTFGG